MNIKSNILLTDSINKLHNNIVLKADLVEPMYQISKSNHFSGSDGLSIAIKANSMNGEPLQPFSTATTTTPYILSTSLPRTQPSFTTILKTTCESGSKSPVSVSLVRSHSEPNRTSHISDGVSNMKSSHKSSSNFNIVSNHFSRQNSVPVSNASVIAFTSTESNMSKSSKKMDPTESGLTMSGLTIQRISNTIPSVNASYQNQSMQCNRDFNRNTNALEIVCANINNSSDSSGHLVGNKNDKNYVMYKGSLEDYTNINSNDYGLLNNRKSIKREGKSYCNYISSSAKNGESCKSYTTSVSADADSSSRYQKVNPVISIIPVVPTFNITTNGNTVSNKGNEVSLYESCISHKEDQRHKQNLKAQQLMPNSVTITQLQPNSINTVPKPHQSKLIYRASSYEEDHIIVPPVMIVDRQESYSIGVDSGLYTMEQGTSCGNPVTITPVSYSTPDTCMDDPHPLNLFSTVAANQEYLPTSTTTSSTTHDINSYMRSAQSKIMNAEIHTLSQHGNHLYSGQLVTSSNNEFPFSDFMDHNDSQCLSPPPAGMQRRPKVSYKNLTEGEKNIRLRMLNNEASRLYRYRKQHTIKNLEMEERQLQAVNSKLRVEFEALQLKRDEAMKMLHESLQRCRDCNPSQPVQSGPCPHKNINSPFKSAKVDTHTTKLIIKNQIRNENM